jgi:Fur family transcriptional regulator, ferric uptake regulator
MKTQIHDQFTRYLRATGKSKTTPRNVVLGEIVAGPRHFETEGLAAALKKRNVRASRATVYRTVSHLVKSGILREVVFDSNRTCYELTSGRKPHEHCVCVRCGKVTEFTDAGLDDRLNAVSRANRFIMTGRQIALTGICEECAD